jgi:hypothetical protein
MDPLAGPSSSSASKKRKSLNTEVFGDDSDDSESIKRKKAKPAQLLRIMPDVEKRVRDAYMHMNVYVCVCVCVYA